MENQQQKEIKEATQKKKKTVSDTAQSFTSITVAMDKNKDCANKKDDPETNTVPSEVVIVDVPKTIPLTTHQFQNDNLFINTTNTTNSATNTNRRGASGS